MTHLIVGAAFGIFLVVVIVALAIILREEFEEMD